MAVAKNDVLVCFGQAIRSRRIALDLTQEVFAEKAELHRTYIADIERGTRNVSLQNIEKLAHALGCSLETLFADVEKGRK
ncbi:MAG: helix-turn-helix transcriptional regulator [Kiritimatiellae bacterium]|jgi:transcriptional regulator with XRE-family HTH domain|nr:helix-turn-helix transcriptional regulator [Kiritimatiellia bacterium]MDD3585480.1 helix-turn-helix transcriptional regulator [Kiritimatiellia bacterium]